MSEKLLVICGPTASGKSELAVRIAGELDGEVVNADSLQVYRGMDIGTAKLSMEERRGIPHHLLDIVTPDTPFSAADYVRAAGEAISGIRSRGKRPIVAGGAGLYIRTLLRGLADSPGGAGEVRRALQEEARECGNEAMLEKLRKVDPDAASRIHPNNLVRIIRALEVHRMTGVPISRVQREHAFNESRYESLQIGIKVERSELFSRIDSRVDRMLAGGLADETRSLIESGYGRDLKPMRAIGYKEMAAHLAGECTLEEASELIRRSTRQYAKRQITWFRSDESILWLEYTEKSDTILKTAINFMV